MTYPLKRDPPSKRPPRAVQCSVVLGTGACKCGAPEELIILAHGLQGDVDDFTYFLDALDSSLPGKSGKILVHASSVNTERTHDGVIAGGERLAYDVRAVVAAHPSLRSISLVGFSLGGLYVRYAAAVLYDAEKETIAGLEPSRMIAVAAPHLGVRNFGVYRFLPAAVKSKAHLFIGDTGTELFLEDTNALLVRMSQDDPEPDPNSTTDADNETINNPSPTLTPTPNTSFDAIATAEAQIPSSTEANGDSITPAAGARAGASASAGSSITMPSTRVLKFISALRCFPKRYLYANTRGDFMVNWGTAALDHSIGELSITNPLDALPTGAVAVDQADIDRAHDDRGCKVSFTVRYPSVEANVTNEHIAPMVVGEEERVIAARLRDIGWTVVAVDFPVSLPIAHNRIVAMSRNPIHTWMNAPGRRVVHHLVDTLLDDGENHEPTFQAVDREPPPRRSLNLRQFSKDL